MKAPVPLAKHPKSNVINIHILGVVGILSRTQHDDQDAV
tara:strand:+ start:2363 stop:2479 length:117 start_codon:yes stop_codon:yes gene_type:complete